MAEHWFRSSERGGGPWPSRWQGWAVIALFGLAETAIWILLLLRPWVEGRLDANLIVAWAALIAALIIAFVWVLKARTEDPGP